jgi:hypothetical protein
MLFHGEYEYEKYLKLGIKIPTSCFLYSYLIWDYVEIHYFDDLC